MGEYVWVTFSFCILVSKSKCRVFFVSLFPRCRVAGFLLNSGNFWVTEWVICLFWVSLIEVIFHSTNNLYIPITEFQVPKMEVLNIIRLFWGWVFPYISRIHTACIGEDTSILGTTEMFGVSPQGAIMAICDPTNRKNTCFM